MVNKSSANDKNNTNDSGGKNNYCERSKSDNNDGNFVLSCRLMSSQNSSVPTPHCEAILWLWSLAAQYTTVIQCSWMNLMMMTVVVLGKSSHNSVLCWVVFNIFVMTWLILFFIFVCFWFSKKIKSTRNMAMRIKILSTKSTYNIDFCGIVSIWCIWQKGSFKKTSWDLKDTNGFKWNILNFRASFFCVALKYKYELSTNDVFKDIGSY